MASRSRAERSRPGLARRRPRPRQRCRVLVRARSGVTSRRRSTRRRSRLRSRAGPRPATMLDVRRVSCYRCRARSVPPGAWSRRPTDMRVLASWTGNHSLPLDVGEHDALAGTGKLCRESQCIARAPVSIDADDERSVRGSHRTPVKGTCPRIHRPGPGCSHRWGRALICGASSIQNALGWVRERDRMHPRADVSRRPPGRA